MGTSSSPASPIRAISRARNALQRVPGAGANYDVFVTRIEVPEASAALLAIASIAALAGCVTVRPKATTGAASVPTR